MRSLLHVAIMLAALSGPSVCLAAEPLPRSVLIFDQSEPNSPWGLEFRAAFRRTLNVGSTTPIAVYSEIVDLGRFNGPQYEELLRTFLREKYRDKPVGVIVVQGSAALKLLLRLRGELWSGVPVVFAAVDAAAATPSLLPPDVTGSILRLPFRNGIVAARSLVPGLKRIVLVGDPFERQPFFSHFQQELQDFTADLEFVDLLGLPMEELKRRVAVLPDDAAILYTAIYRDGAGVTYVPREALLAVAEAANRPIVVNGEPQIGYGGTGGFVILADPVGRDSAQRALRILNGESASQIPVTVGDFARPVFDWRQLQRWNISESRLPPGSEIRFRPAGMWEQYRLQVILAVSVVLFQSVTIFGLLLERHRRRAAGSESRGRVMEMEIARMDRALTAGVMSASLAHELDQPLGAILSNAEAAELLLTASPVDLDQLKAILADIRRDDQRAGEIIRHVRELLRKKPDVALEELDLNETIQSALQILAPEAAKRGVVLSANQVQRFLRVRADQVHLEQVILNLAMNGMDAMQTCAPGTRRLSLETALADDYEVEVSVADTGTGVPNDELKDVFETFYTTKQQGTGLGLSVARTIVETYRGRIWAENRPGGGAVFRFALPLASARSA